MMLISVRLVTPMCTFGRRWRTRSSTKSRTTSRGVGIPEMSGHSSSASMMMYVGCSAPTSASFRQIVKALLRAIPVFQIKTGNNVMTRARVGGELNEQGGEEVADVLFIFVPKVKVEI